MTPLYYLLRFCKFEKYPDILTELFKIVLILLRNKPDN